LSGEGIVQFLFGDGGIGEGVVQKEALFVEDIVGGIVKQGAGSK